MALFGRSPKPDPVATLDQVTEGRLERLETGYATLRNEWLETLDMLNRVLGRITRRAGHDNPKPPEHIAPAVDAITARILARRHGNGVRSPEG